VRDDGTRPVPLRLRNAPTALMKGLDYGKGYRYAHDEAGGFAAGERYWPDDMTRRRASTSRSIAASRSASASASPTAPLNASAGSTAENRVGRRSGRCFPSGSSLGGGRLFATRVGAAGEERCAVTAGHASGHAAEDHTGVRRMETFIQQIINGLVLGSVYALVALGYTMVYGIINLINFAHGDVLMVGR
jgi:hypothetical protein